MNIKIIYCLVPRACDKLSKFIKLCLFSIVLYCGVSPTNFFYIIFSWWIRREESKIWKEIQREKCKNWVSCHHCLTKFEQFERKKESNKFNYIIQGTLTGASRAVLPCEKYCSNWHHYSGGHTGHHTDPPRGQQVRTTMIYQMFIKPYTKADQHTLFSSFLSSENIFHHYQFSFSVKCLLNFSRFFVFQ